MSISLTIAAFVIGFTVSWKLSLVLFSFVPVVVFIVYYMVKNMRGAGIADSKAYASAGAIAEETINNIKTNYNLAGDHLEIYFYINKIKILVVRALNFFLFSNIINDIIALSNKMKL
jgi:ATP-binding cassette subfamily B (MDR/TAP) protein 1